MAAVYEAVVLRLAMLGYTAEAEDKAALEYCIRKCERDILDDINRAELPEGLFYTLVDMAAGCFLRERKAAGALDGMDFAMAAKSITEGDVSITFAGGEGEAGFDALLTRLIHPPGNILAAYRRIRWT